MAAPQPFPYQGSKRALAAPIRARLDALAAARPFRRLVEPFAGSAALSLAAAGDRPGLAFWLNDAHPALAALWRGILADPGGLAAGYARLWAGEPAAAAANYAAARAAFNADPVGDPARLLYLMGRCVKAAPRYNASGHFNNSADRRRLGATPAAVRARLLAAAALLAGRTEVTCRDYAAVLADCGPGDVVYLDPPYQGVSGRRDGRYACGIDHAGFCDRLADLGRRGVPHLVSYDGRTGDKGFGPPLPASLGLTRVELPAGRSAQATLLGRDAATVESLYLSPGWPGSAGEPAAPPA